MKARQDQQNEIGENFIWWKEWFNLVTELNGGKTRKNAQNMSENFMKMSQRTGEREEEQNL